MRLFLAVSSLALLAASPLAAQPGRNHLWSSYDELESCTMVLAKVATRPVRGDQYLFQLDGRAMIRDSGRTAPIEDVVFVALTEHREDDDRLSTDPELTLVLDDSVRLRYDGAYMKPFPAEYLSGGVMTRARYWVPAADLRRIARASRVRGRALLTEFTLASREREALRQLSDFVARSPRAPTPRPSRQGVTDCDSYPTPPDRRPSDTAARPPAGEPLAARVSASGAETKAR